MPWLLDYARCGHHYLPLSHMWTSILGVLSKRKCTSFLSVMHLVSVQEFWMSWQHNCRWVWVHTPVIGVFFFYVLCLCWCKCKSSALIASISSDTLCAKRHIIILCVTVQFLRLLSRWYIFLCKAKPNKLKIWWCQSSRICCCVVGELVHLTIGNEDITSLCGTGHYSSKDAASHPRYGNFELHCCVNLKTCDVKFSHPY
jgi:hypothetical protein